jgi:type IV pilus assembly protein PilV
MSKKRRHAGGFTLIEVLVALVVAGVGLLGLAKLQAASLSNTQISRVRSLVALQMEGLAAAMHGNPGFWSNVSAVPAAFSMNGTVVTDASNTLNAATPDCKQAVCNTAQLAAYDVQAWAAAMNSHFPTYNATVACSSSSTSPVSCSLTTTWQESYTAINQNTVVGGGQTATQSLTLHVQP